MSLVQTAVLAGFLFLALEVALPALIFLGFAFGAFAVAMLALFRDFSVGTYVVVFALVSGLVWFAMRAVFRHREDAKDAEGDVNRY